MNQFPLGSEYPIGAVQNFYEIRGDIHNFVFIAVINNTRNNVCAGVNDTSDKFSLVTMTPAMIIR